MADAEELVKAMKRAAVAAQEATKPVYVYFGVVETASPLTVNVEQKMLLDESQLILSRNVTDYMTEVTVQWDTLSENITHTHDVDLTDSNGDTVQAKTESKTVKHAHDIEGRKQMTIHNGLLKGEKVTLLRQQEGQKFIVWDRIGGGSV